MLIDVRLYQSNELRNFLVRLGGHVAEGLVENGYINFYCVHVYSLENVSAQHRKSVAAMEVFKDMFMEASVAAFAVVALSRVIRHLLGYYGKITLDSEVLRALEVDYRHPRYHGCC